MNRNATITAIAMVSSFAFFLSASDQAYSQTSSRDPITWGGLKATFGGRLQDSSSEKIDFPSPWPFPYTCHSSIDTTSAKIAMMRVGIQALSNCSDVFVMSSTNSVANGEIALVTATRSDDRPGMWLVDLLDRVVTEEFVITSLDANSLEVQNVTFSQTITAEEIDAAAVEESTQDHLAACSEEYTPEDPVGQEGFWDNVKEWWGGMNLCEKVTVVTGLVACSTVGGFYSLACGAGFSLMYAQC